MAHCGNEDLTLTRNASLGICNSSVGNNSDVVFETESSLIQVVKLSFQVLIALVGVIGNAIVVTVINRQGRKKNSLDFYILNLAIADLGTLLFTFPLAVVRETLPMKWPLGQFVCRFVSPVPEIFYGASVWGIALIGIERYRKIATMTVRVGKKSNASLTRAKIVAAFVWFSSFLVFSFPLYFIVDYRELEGGGQWCGPVWPSWDRSFLLARLYMCVLTALSFIIPLGVIAWTYIPISRKIRESSTFIKTMHLRERNHQTGHDLHWVKRRSKVDKRLRQNRRAKKMLTPIAIVFAATMLPLNIFRLTVAFWPRIVQQEYYKHLHFTVAIFVIINSSINPLIYSLVSIEFRQGARRVFRCVKPRKYFLFSSGIELRALRFHSSLSH